jgi:hypothetical protein
MRRISLLIAALATLVFSTPALAAPGCGQGWELVDVATALDRVDERIYNAEEWVQIVALVESVDANGDDLLCINQFKPNRGQDKHWIGPEDVGVSDYVVTGILDNKAKGQGT